MSSLNDKVDKLIHDINSLGSGVPAECQDEVVALKQDARDLRQAQLNRDSALKNVAAGSVTAGGSVTGGILCGLAATTGVGILACVVAGGVGLVGGGLWADGAGDSLAAAEEEMDDVLDAMNKHSDALCRCLMQHLNP